MNMYTYIRKYVRLYIQTHIQTEIISFKAFYTWFQNGTFPFVNIPLAAMLNLEIGRSRSGISVICL